MMCHVTTTHFFSEHRFSEGVQHLLEAWVEGGGGVKRREEEEEEGGKRR